jgi:ribosomal protein S12 methylthiotransferase
MPPNYTKRPLRVGLISLGCAKNLVDAEILLGALLKDGMEITNDATTADVVVVNTCSFIDSAQEESVDAILESAQLREVKRRKQGLVVSGCLPQRFREELPKLLPEVDVFMGIDQVAQAPELVRAALERRAIKLRSSRDSSSGRELKRPRPPKSALIARFAKTEANSPAGTGPRVDVNARPHYIPDYATPRFRLTPRHFAYLKIAEGCNHPCSFCIIPRMRGAHRSRAPQDIVAEARALLAGGVKELNLISQDSTYYGLDLRQNHSRAISSPEKFVAAVRSLPGHGANLPALLRELNALPGDFWVRLLYTHPAHWTDELIQTIAGCPKVARYVDIPLQHIHDNMLERMRRETSRQYIVDLLRRIRAGIPGISLRTTFIVGFPGETEACFHALLDFVRETKFERLGVFTYSREEGTRAGNMAGQIPAKIRQARRDQVMAVQREVARGVCEAAIGRTLKVLVETPAQFRAGDHADVRSWEHGLLREGERSPRALAAGPWMIARGEADAPDIDGRVYVRGALPGGTFANVRVTGHSVYDLMAELAS